MKKQNAKTLATIIGAAALPVLATLTAGAAHGAVVLNVTDLGTPISANGSTTLSGYEAFDISLSTDDGGNIQAVNFGNPGDISNVFGITYTGASGGFLQQVNFTNPGFTNTPVNAAKNSSTPNNARSLSFDTHFLVPTPSRADVTAPTEDSDHSNPVPGSTSAGDTTTGLDYGYGTYLKGVFGIQGANQGTSLDLAYVVIPKTGGQFTVNGTAADSTNTTTASTLFGVFPAPAAGGGPVISLTATAAGGVSATPLVGTSNPGVTGINPVGNAAAGYVKGELNSIVAGKTGSTDVRFQSTLGGATTDPGIEYIGLNLADTGSLATDEAALIADINGVSGFTAIDSTGSLTQAQQSALAALNGGHGTGFYDVLISHSSVNGGDAFLGLDLSQDATLSTLSVTDIAAVPEPASVMGLLVGASGLLMGRRKRKA